LPAASTVKLAQHYGQRLASPWIPSYDIGKCTLLSGRWQTTSLKFDLAVRKKNTLPTREEN